MNVQVEGRDARQGRGGGPEDGDRPIRFGDAMVGFAVMTALVAVAATGAFILMDPRAQAFWGARLSELGTLLRGALRF